MANQDRSSTKWEELFDKHPDIPDIVARDGLFHIKASEIKKFREPRLMTKHDSTECVPRPLRKLGLNVLPVSRSEYVLGDFKTFHDFPPIVGESPRTFILPEYETLDIEHISSESNAINALLLSGILDDFLDEPNTVETFSGRMGTGDFSFSIERKTGELVDIDVSGAQLEIDGGFENDESVTIMEAKNVIYPDFQVRQLYYPFRKYFDLVNRKKIRLVFSQYTNLTYRLYEFRFDDPLDFNSLSLVQSCSYALTDTRITPEDIFGVWRETAVEYMDDMNESSVPFIQADKFDRLTSICEFLQGYPDGATTDELADFMGTTLRQVAYYPTAGEYLHIIERPRNGLVRLSSLGKSLFSFDYRNRQLGLCEQIFKHEIFHELYEKTYHSGALPNRDVVVKLMLELNVCNDGSTVHRRASSVIGWLRWLMELPDAD